MTVLPRRPLKSILLHQRRLEIKARLRELTSGCDAEPMVQRWPPTLLAVLISLATVEVTALLREMYGKCGLGENRPQLTVWRAWGCRVIGKLSEGRVGSERGTSSGGQKDCA